MKVYLFIIYSVIACICCMMFLGTISFCLKKKTGTDRVESDDD